MSRYFLRYIFGLAFGKPNTIVAGREARFVSFELEKQ
jgi:hypothetical protein